MPPGYPYPVADHADQPCAHPVRHMVSHAHIYSHHANADHPGKGMPASVGKRHDPLIAAHA